LRVTTRQLAKLKREIYTTFLMRAGISGIALSWHVMSARAGDLATLIVCAETLFRSVLWDGPGN
jgi:hypothetical protein